IIIIFNRDMFIFIYILFLDVYINTYIIYFFFQAEDGIRDRNVTGVQTCALPISCRSSRTASPRSAWTTTWRSSRRPTTASSAEPRHPTIREGGRAPVRAPGHRVVGCIDQLSGTSVGAR